MLIRWDISLALLTIAPFFRIGRLNIIESFVGHFSWDVRRSQGTTMELGDVLFELRLGAPNASGLY
jgi:hypothetical protein